MKLQPLINEHVEHPVRCFEKPFDMLDFVWKISIRNSMERCVIHVGTLNYPKSFSHFFYHSIHKKTQRPTTGYSCECNIYFGWNMMNELYVWVRYIGRLCAHVTYKINASAVSCIYFLMCVLPRRFTWFLETRRRINTANLLRYGQYIRTLSYDSMFWKVIHIIHTNCPHSMLSE